MGICKPENTRTSRIVRILVVTGAALFGGQTVGLAQAPAAPKVEVRGVRIVGDAYGANLHVQGGDEQGVRAFNWTKGTTIALLITKLDGGIVEINREKCQLTRFADDKGTNLAAVRDAMQEEPFNQFPTISPDGKACLVEINRGAVPAKGAASISISGTVTVRCGSKKETAKQENVALKAGAKIAAGPIAFEVDRVGKPEMLPLGPMPGEAKPEETWQVTLRANADCSNIVEIKFLDAAGTEIKIEPAFKSSMNVGNGVIVEQSFNLHEKADSATVVITYWADMKEVKVPFEVKATLGLD